MRKLGKEEGRFHRGSSGKSHGGLAGGKGVRKKGRDQERATLSVISSCRDSQQKCGEMKE